VAIPLPPGGWPLVIIRVVRPRHAIQEVIVLFLLVLVLIVRQPAAAVAAFILAFVAVPVPTRADAARRLLVRLVRAIPALALGSVVIAFVAAQVGVGVIRVRHAIHARCGRLVVVDAAAVVLVHAVLKVAVAGV
jgi:hypothetical protein